MAAISHIWQAIFITVADILTALIFGLAEQEIFILTISFHGKNTPISLIYKPIIAILYTVALMLIF
ncbi:hypothetical protein B1R44_05905 [Serratia marcescens]|nr:hypothetical protein B1R44_05905 [Serratia marcescens]